MCKLLHCLFVMLMFISMNVLFRVSTSCINKTKTQNPHDETTQKHTPESGLWPSWFFTYKFVRRNLVITINFLHVPMNSLLLMISHLVSLLFSTAFVLFHVQIIIYFFFQCLSFLNTIPQCILLLKCQSHYL